MSGIRYLASTRADEGRSGAVRSYVFTHVGDVSFSVEL